MAHVEKVKSVAVAPMVGHYERAAELRGYERENIDPTRIYLNRAVGFASQDCAELAQAVRARVAEAIASHEAATGKAIRKDANVVMDWVVTLPKDCPPESMGEFFDAAVSFVQGRYGEKNVLGGFLHLDETTPHVHIPVVPQIGEKLQASKVVTRLDLKSFHSDLGKAVDAALGFHVSIELDAKQRGEKALSHVPQKDLDAARQEMHEKAAYAQAAEMSARTAAERETRRARKARQDAARAEKQRDDAECAARSAKRSLEEFQACIAEESARLERVRREREAAENRVGWLERRVAAARAAIAEAREYIRGLAERGLMSAQRPSFGLEHAQSVQESLDTSRRQIGPYEPTQRPTGTRRR